MTNSVEPLTAEEARRTDYCRQCPSPPRAHVLDTHCWRLRAASIRKAVMNTYVIAPSEFDIAVVGAGHAGCEAAVAAARMGLRVGLVTLSLDGIAQMPCNPAIGGIAKGHLVREIDALGGVMGEVADATGIQFRLLNTSRGPAVWSPRAQCDKALYRVRMRELLEREPNVTLVQAEVAGLLVETSAGGLRTVRGFAAAGGASAACRKRAAGGGYDCDDGHVFERADSLRGTAVFFGAVGGAGVGAAGGIAEAAGAARARG